MFTLLFGLIFVLMVAMNLLQIRADRNKTVRRSRSDSRGMRIFKRVCAGCCAAVLLIICGWLILIPHTQEQITLNVYNWGQYIADGSDGSMEVIAEFEARYPHIKVNYSTYDSNEIMYSKLNPPRTG